MSFRTAVAPTPRYVTYRGYAAPGLTMTLNNAQSCWTLWHPSTSTKLAQITRFIVSVVGGAGSATASGDFQIHRVTAEGTGGTMRTPVPLDSSDGSAACTVREGPLTTNPTRDAAVAELIGYSTSQLVFEWKAADWGAKTYTMRPGQSEGWEMQMVNGPAFTTSANVYFMLEWTEF